MGGVVGRRVVMSALLGKGVHTVKPYGLVSKAGPIYDSTKA